MTDDDDEEQAGESEAKSSGGKQEDPSGHDKKDDWDLATRYRDIQRLGHLEPKKRKEMSKSAIREILNRAHASLGPIQKPYRYQSVGEDQAQVYQAHGQMLELDIEESLLAQEVMFQARVEQNHGILLLLDTSLSMKGEKLALLGVTVAAVAQSVPKDSLCILGFDSEVHPIKEFTDILSTEQLVERVLSIPPGGFTNIELGLTAALARVRDGNRPRSRVILVSDGRYTEGAHPIDTARQFHFIYPVKLGKDPGGTVVMRSIAQASSGRVSEVREMKDLPRFLLNAIRTWVK